MTVTLCVILMDQEPLCPCPTSCFCNSFQECHLREQASTQIIDLLSVCKRL